MHDTFAKSLNHNTGIVIRFDDIAPNMNWTMMEKCEELFDMYNIKPVLGVIPNNQDKELMNYPIKNNFWKIVKDWQLKNWSIAMHGYSHLYSAETNKKDYFGYGGKSEFFGHSYNDQFLKIKKGLTIFQENNIDVDTFFAPNHTYDVNTFKALKECGIFRVIDGYGLSTYVYDEIKFVPQLFYNLYMLPYGIQSTQIHINDWKENNFQFFKSFVEKYHTKIINLDRAFSINNSSTLIKFLNTSIEALLKTIRKVY